MVHIKHDQNETGDPDSEAGYIQQGDQQVFPDMTKGELEIMFNHGPLFLPLLEQWLCHIMYITNLLHIMKFQQVAIDEEVLDFNASACSITKQFVKQAGMFYIRMTTAGHGTTPDTDYRR
jgi:hypothetical protein